MTLSIQPIADLGPQVTTGFHKRPWTVGTYHAILRKLILASEKAIKETLEVVNGVKKVMVETENKPRFLKKMQRNTVMEIQKEASIEQRMAFRKLLSDMQDEITGSLPEIKWLYNQAIREGLDVYYLKDTDLATLEVQASNFGRRYKGKKIETMASTFVTAVEEENAPLLYYLDRYSEVAEDLDQYLIPWREKVASNNNSDVDKLKRLIFEFVNLPQLLNALLGGPLRETGVGLLPEDIMFMTLLEVSTDQLNNLNIGR